MKSLVFCLIVLTPLLAWAEESEIGIYHQTLVEKGGKVTPRFFLQGYSYLGEKYGVWGFAYLEKEYFSSVAGFFYKLHTFSNDAVLEAGLVAGAETFPKDGSGYKLYPRFAGTVFAGNKKLFSEIYYENGTSGEGWLRAHVLWKVQKYVGVRAIH